MMSIEADRKASSWCRWDVSGALLSMNTADGALGLRALGRFRELSWS